MGAPEPDMPSDVVGDLSVFDRFAGAAASFASRAPFFASSLLLVIAWLIEGAVLVVHDGSFHAFLNQTYQLQINTLTTIITFLLVALLQNSQSRADHAVQHKLNAMAEALADLMEHVGKQYDNTEIMHDIDELRAGIGLEQREGSSRR